MRYFPRQVKSTVSCTNRFDFLRLGTVASACFTSVAVSKFVFAASEKSITSCLSIKREKKPTQNMNLPFLQVNDYKRCNGVTDNYCPSLPLKSVKSRMSFKFCLPIQNFCNLFYFPSLWKTVLYILHLLRMTLARSANFFQEIISYIKWADICRKFWKKLSKIS